MDTTRLQGRWIVVEFEDSGVPVPPGAGITALEFAGDTLFLEAGPADPSDRLGLLFSSDPTTSPPSLDIQATTPDGDVFFMTGIYAFEGEQLRVCWNDSGHGRPATFKTDAQTTGFSFLLERAPAVVQ